MERHGWVGGGWSRMERTCGEMTRLARRSYCSRARRIIKKGTFKEEKENRVETGPCGGTMDDGRLAMSGR